jgi:hypothetical protein
MYSVATTTARYEAGELRVQAAEVENSSSRDDDLEWKDHRERIPRRRDITDRPFTAVPGLDLEGFSQFIANALLIDASGKQLWQAGGPRISREWISAIIPVPIALDADLYGTAAS